MGKYTKNKGEQLALLDSNTDTNTSSFGVRTRSKTLALQKSQSQPELPPTSGDSCLQLLSCQLHKPPISIPSHDSSKRPRHQNPKSSIPNLRSSSRLGLGSVVASDDDEQRNRKVEEKKKKKGIVHENVDGAGVEEASFGENVLDFQDRESTRESIPCSLIRDLDTGRTPGSTTRPTCSAEAYLRTQHPARRKIPSTSHRAPDFTLPPLTPIAQPRPLTQPSCFNPPSHDVVPPTQESFHNLGSSIPPTDARYAPRSNDTQDASDTQMIDSKPILYLDGDGFLPSHLAANGISDIFRRHYFEPWTSWKKITDTTRDMWFAEFMRKYSVTPPDDYWARKNFEKRGAALLRNTLEKARKKMKKPNWLGDHVWDRLCAHWESEAFKKKSAQAKVNRASDCEGFGGSYHTCGSITSSQHRANLTQLNGVAPSPSNLFRHTHQHKDHTWVDRRSAHIAETFIERMQERTQRASEQGAPQPHELDVWRDVAGVKKGRIYGLGLESTVVAGRLQYRGSSSLSSQWARREEVEELRSERDELRARLDNNERQRDELQARLENNERQIESTNQLLQEMMARMNFQPLQPFPGYQLQRKRRKVRTKRTEYL